MKYWTDCQTIDMICSYDKKNINICYHNFLYYNIIQSQKLLNPPKISKLGWVFSIKTETI